MSIRERTQRRLFNQALWKLERAGSDEERQLIGSMTAPMRDDIYQLAIDRFLVGKDKNREVIAYDESQTPILDKLLEFFTWLYESGALMDLIKLIIGGGLMVADSDVVAFYEAQFASTQGVPSE